MNDQLVVEEESMESAATSFAKASEPGLPQIDPPGSGSVTLMWGLAGAEETGRETAAEVRELNGADEEAMARLNENDPAYFSDLVDIVLRRAVEQVGTTAITPINGAKVLGELIMADRDLLFKEIILATFGSERSYEGIRCPACKGENDIEIDVPGIIEVNTLEGEPVTQIELRDGRVVDLHYPLGTDQKFVYDTKEETTGPGYNTRMIARCIDAVDGVALRGEHAAQQFALKLGMADRRKIVAAISDGPSVRFKEVEVPCIECGEAIPFAFGWADLLWV